MPLTSDPQVLKTTQELLAEMHSAFGPQPGFRGAHAKGILLTGTFTPAPIASTLSTAPHFAASSTPITVRFSNSTGLPKIPDHDPQADPRGIAIRFNLGPHKHTDIVGHSTPFFPTRTGEGFLGLMRAVAASPAGTPSPTPIEKFLGETPSALAFVRAPKPAPKSYAEASFYSVNAFRLVAADGTKTTVRYRILPAAAPSDAPAEDKGDVDYLQTELEARIGAGPAEMRLVAQIAEPGDVDDDATARWPEERKVVELGTLVLEEVVGAAEQAGEQKKIIFDPVPRVEGIEASKDPLLEVRAALYLLGGRERRAA